VKLLGTTLNGIGAEIAGNKAGTIPAWDGGVCKPPAGYAPVKGAAGGAPYLDIYAGDKPLFKITAADLDKYGEQVDEGTKALLKRYASFAMNVYPTRRPACFPAWVYQNSINRVMNPKLTGGGLGITGAHAQVPFPIPKSGYEVMWNANLKYDLPHSRGEIDSGIVDASGKFIRMSYQVVDSLNLYWDNELKGVPDDTAHWAIIATTKHPAGAAGTMNMRQQFLRTDLKNPAAYSYLPAQRRVRLAPDFTYDTVSTTSGGILLFDEINGFDGKMDKFDFKLLGKKEMYVPYNTYKISSAPPEQQSTRNHANVDLMRWELHRVWVVEATLKNGERHVQQKKVFLVDEDSWNIVVYYGVDHSGKIHHLMHMQVSQQYDKPLARNGHMFLYDLARGIYGNQNNQMTPQNPGYYKVPKRPVNYFSPDAMTGMGVR
jgi:hypothetical protein